MQNEIFPYFRDFFCFCENTLRIGKAVRENNRICEEDKILSFGEKR